MNHADLRPAVDDVSLAPFCHKLRPRPVFVPLFFRLTISLQRRTFDEDVVPLFSQLAVDRPRCSPLAACQAWFRARERRSWAARRCRTAARRRSSHVPEYERPSPEMYARSRRKAGSTARSCSRALRRSAAPPPGGGALSAMRMAAPLHRSLTAAAATVRTSSPVHDALTGSSTYTWCAPCGSTCPTSTGTDGVRLVSREDLRRLDARSAAAEQRTVSRSLYRTA